jgi:NAD(P)-dependent dehydrogenase (short-subunit alcohol dehydrogenase family)
MRSPLPAVTRLGTSVRGPAIEADNEGHFMTRTWLITDASGRFGRELAKTVLASGDGVVAAARRPEQLDDLVQEYGDSVRAVPLDVTDGAAARDAVQTAVDRFGALDVVVNNAGYASVSRVEGVTEDDFLFGVVNVTKAALPVLRQQRSGHYIQFSSRGGRVGGAHGLVYQTAKSVIEAFSEVLNTEVRPFGIKVTIVEPDGFGAPSSALPARTVRPARKTARHTVRAVKNDESSLRLMVRYHASRDRTRQGDPARGARVIRDIVRLAEPPHYLLLASEKLSDPTRNLVRDAQRLPAIGQEQ